MQGLRKEPKLCLILIFLKLRLYSFSLLTYPTYYIVDKDSKLWQSLLDLVLMENLKRGGTLQGSQIKTECKGSAGSPNVVSFEFF